MSQQEIEPFFTFEKEGRSEHIVEKSRFIGYAFPLRQRDEIDVHLKAIRKEHYNARHVVLGARVGHGDTCFSRFSDDGEPSRTAGFPILQLLEGEEITNAVVIVVRYFGGIKLGTGGLSRAYREAARLAIDAANKIEVVPRTTIHHAIAYPLLDIVRHRLPEVESLRIEAESFGADVSIEFSIETRHLESFEPWFNTIIYG